MRGAAVVGGARTVEHRLVSVGALGVWQVEILRYGLIVLSSLAFECRLSPRTVGRQVA